MTDWVTLKNQLGLTLRPIDVWPGKPRAKREMSPFSAPVKDTVATLKRELSALGAKNIVLQIALREQDLRLDGLPRAGAIATHPGIILAFDSRHGSLRLFFDRFSRWEHNLRAIAMHLEHLRHAGLYGVGTDGQQYQGWQALPAPPPQHFTSALEAAIFLASYGGESRTAILEYPAALSQAYRYAAKALHPDTGGDAEQFKLLGIAKDLIEKHQRERR